MIGCIFGGGKDGQGNDRSSDSEEGVQDDDSYSASGEDVKMVGMDSLLRSMRMNRTAALYPRRMCMRMIVPVV